MLGGAPGAEAPSAEQSSWGQLGDWAKNNPDILLGLAQGYNKYATDQSHNDADNMIQAAKAKWSGFNPALMAGLEAPKQANLINELTTGATLTGPGIWGDLSKVLGGGGVKLREEKYARDEEARKGQEANPKFWEAIQRLASKHGAI